MSSPAWRLRPVDAGHLGVNPTTGQPYDRTTVGSARCVCGRLTRMRRRVAVVLIVGLVVVSAALRPRAASGPSAVELQPLAAQVGRVVEALQYLGSPLPEADRRAIAEVTSNGGANDRAAIAKIQEVLDKHCLLEVHINPESRVHVTAGQAPAELVEQGWRTFLLKVYNEAGVTAPLRISSPQALRVFSRGPNGFSMSPKPDQT